MFVTCVHVWVEEEHIEDFVEATVANHERSVEEPGNMRFDVLRSREEPGRFLLYEAYGSEEAAKAHKETAHYLRWRETVADWMARPREGVRYDSIRP